MKNLILWIFSGFMNVVIFFALLTGILLGMACGSMIMPSQMEGHITAQVLGALAGAVIASIIIAPLVLLIDMRNSLKEIEKKICD
jgi:uncharacterized protein YacL